MQRLMRDEAFKAFVYRMMIRGGFFAVSTSGSDGRDLSFSEGRRSMVVEMLHEIEAAMPVPSADGNPILGSIQILSAVPQIVAKEKALGRRSDHDHDDGDPSSDHDR